MRLRELLPVTRVVAFTATEKNLLPFTSNLLAKVYISGFMWVCMCVCSERGCRRLSVNIRVQFMPY